LIQQPPAKQHFLAALSMDDIVNKITTAVELEDVTPYSGKLPFFANN